MQKEKDSIKNIIKVTFLVCLISSVAVSTAVIQLKPIQTKNEIINRTNNILKVAGTNDNSKIEAKVIDLTNGQFANKIDPHKFDQIKSLSIKGMFNILNNNEDLAGLGGKVEKHSLIYLVWNDNKTKLDRIIFPIRGYGLWSTMFAYIAIANDFNTIEGITFYQQAETPGLGGEVENPNWTKQWKNKKLYDDKQKVIFNIVKNISKPDEIDSISGATLTSNGVLNMIDFWFGDASSKYGFYNFLNNLKKGLIKVKSTKT